MNSDLLFFGIPAETMLIVGGLFIISALSPTLVALILKHKKVFKDE
ncbi:prophage tail gpP-like protein [Anaerosolibacter carboniphilus]|uniref:Prophage tail gpP-like protein n=1 Tax=Anaerosolibacter carboniphilus TaxID=1417629 RepID=A0A841L668_9FIRM|nr:hypothetical protein [Anaerosolibacter carboniphilus]MBB6218592.1 prophage tail gpP-like protein [Anaerosolibacter carboniphilus]